STESTIDESQSCSLVLLFEAIKVVVPIWISLEQEFQDFSRHVHVGAPCGTPRRKGKVFVLLLPTSTCVSLLVMNCSTISTIETGRHEFRNRLMTCVCPTLSNAFEMSKNATVQLFFFLAASRK